MTTLQTVYWKFMLLMNQSKKLENLWTGNSFSTNALLLSLHLQFVSANCWRCYP